MPAGRSPRIAVYSDFAYRTCDGALYTDQAFVVFLAALRPYVGELTLVGRHDPTPRPWHYRIPADVRFAPLPHYRSLADLGQALRATVGSVRRFRRVLDDVDAVWLLGPHPLSLLFAVVAVLARKRVVLGVRQHLPAYARHRHPDRRALHLAALALEAAQRALARALPVVAVGPELARRYRRARSVLAVPVSLISRRQLEVPPPALAWDGPLTAVTVSRLDAEKNPLLLADVLAAADERWRLVVCGEGPLREPLERRLDRLGVAGRADLRGYVPLDGGLLDAYRSAHAFLHVSWTEGFPQVLVEAFAAGIPVVATDVGGVAELAGEAALLIAPGDAAAAAAALERLRADPELRERMVTEGRAIAARHTVEATASAVAGFLAGV